MFKQEIYRSIPNRFQSPGGYWYLRITRVATGERSEIGLLHNKAQELLRLGIPQLADGGGPW